MRTAILHRLAPWGGALALCLGAPGAAPAQDGQPPTGPPTTNPRTNDRVPSTNPTPPQPRTSAEVLPAVPETARDPAPPGTRGVRVDAPGAQAPGAGAVTPTGRPADAARTNGGAARRPSNVLVAEGVVTRLDRAGENLNGELIRFAFDPSQDWYSYINRGAQNVAEKGDDRPKDNEAIKDANEKQHEDSPDQPKVLEMAITKRTYVFTHARTDDGTDQYGQATSASPDVTNSRSGLTNRPDAAQPTRPVATNFTNIKEGSFVAVRYRKVGDLNEVLNLTLIELPLNNPGSITNDPAMPNAPVRGGSLGGSAGTGAGAGGAGAGTGTGTAPAGNATGTGTGTGRTPAVPTTPTGPALPR